MKRAAFLLTFFAATPAYARTAMPPPAATATPASPVSPVRSQLEAYEAKHGILMEAFSHPLGMVGDEHAGFVRFDAILLQGRGREIAKVRAIRVRLIARQDAEEGYDAYVGLDEVDDIVAALDRMMKTAGAERPTDFDHMFYATEDGLIIGFEYGTAIRPFVRWKEEKQALPPDALGQMRDMLKSGREFLKAQ